LKFNLDAPQGKLILEKRVNLHDYTIIKTIGRGAFGKVQLVRDFLLNYDTSKCLKDLYVEFQENTDVYLSFR
jgi:serine/threonine protein kinase